jgi:hypothetical protein
MYLWFTLFINSIGFLHVEQKGVKKVQVGLFEQKKFSFLLIIVPSAHTGHVTFVLIGRPMCIPKFSLSISVANKEGFWLLVIKWVCCNDRVMAT